MNSPMYYGHAYGLSWFNSFGPGITPLFWIFGAIIFAVILALKGYALWSAAKRDEKWWFIAILFLNTLGILEIIYLVFFVKQLHKKHAHHTEHHEHKAQ